MIELTNNGKVVTIEYNEEQECEVLKLAKKMTFKPQQKFTVNTKVEVNCSEFAEECVISELIEDDNLPLFIMADKYSNTNPEKVIELTGYYAGEEELALPKGTVIACVGKYHKCECEHNPMYLSAEEQNNAIIFQNEQIRIQSIDGITTRGCEIVTEPDNNRYVKVGLDEYKQQISSI